MSFIISNKQYLAPTEAKAQYCPMIFQEDGLEVERMDVDFGHPLYTTVADIISIKSMVDEIRPLPVIPDGCMALVIHGKNNTEEIDAFICGVSDEIKKIIIEPEGYYVLIRFLPGIGYPFMKDDAGKLTNKTMRVIDDVTCGEQIMSILERKTQLEGRIRLISKVIRVHMSNKSDKYLIKYCTDRIFQTQGNIRVEKLAEETGFTARHIGKMFEKSVGISPKLYSQIIRLQLSMGYILANKEKLLVDIAVDSGFFDHAHMNRMYKKLVHCSSGEFRDNVLSNLNYETVDDYININ